MFCECNIQKMVSQHSSLLINAAFHAVMRNHHLENTSYKMCVITTHLSSEINVLKNNIILWITTIQFLLARPISLSFRII